MNTNIAKVNDNTKLIDGITIDNSIFDKKDIDLNTYQYDGIYLENLKLKDLLDTDYRANFIKYLKDIKSEDDDFKSTLISQLLFIRIVQLSDTDSFYLLSLFSKDESLSYNGIELFPEELIEFFIENPYFFVQQETKYNDTTIIKYIMTLLDEYLVKENFFENNLGSIDLNGGELFLNPDKEKNFHNISFKNKLSKYKKIECIFSPSLYTEWKNKTIYFVDISPIFEHNLTDKFNSFENNYYKQNILPTLKKYIIASNEKSDPLKGIINDPDGYTNLRKEKNTNSEILQKIKSGEYIDILDNTGDWFLIKTKEGKRGYVHKSRIKFE